VITETEIWPVLLIELERRAVPVVMINGRISDYSWGSYRFFSGFLKGLFQGVEKLVVQTKQDQERYTRLGCAEEKITVAGSSKYDRVREFSYSREDALQNFGYLKTDQVFVAGSVRPEEDSLVG